MSTGHDHELEEPDAKLKALITPEVKKKILALIDACEVDDSYDVLWLGGRSTDLKTVYKDCDIPDELKAGDKTFSTVDMLPWHELPEGYLQEELGVDYYDAHAMATFLFEKPQAEKIGLDWKLYQRAWDDDIEANEDKFKVGDDLDPPPDIDTTPYESAGTAAELKVMESGMTKVDRAVIAKLKDAGLYDGLTALLKDATAADVHATTALGNEDDKKKKKPKAISTVGDTVAKDMEFAVQVMKVDPEQRMVFGWASVCSVDVNGRMTDIVDKQGDIVPVEEMEKAAYEFVLYMREQGEMHTKRDVGRMIESIMFTPEKAQCGLVAKNEDGEQMFGWWVGFKVNNDQTWENHKAGRLPEFSIGGRASSTEVAA